MKKFVISLIVLVAVFVTLAPSYAEVVKPPAINMPAGGKIVTEVNLSDSDVLGIVKQSIPAVADVLKEMGPALAERAGAPSSLDVAQLVNLEEFLEAVSGVKNVRLLIARYPKSMTAERFLSEFNMGVAKTGEFSKTVSDFGFFPGSVALFSAPDNGGIVGFAYNPEEHTAYAVRVVGGLDMPKLIRWAGQIAKFFVVQRKAVVPEQPSVDEPVPGTPAPQPADGADKQ